MSWWQKLLGRAATDVAPSAPSTPREAPGRPDPKAAAELMLAAVDKTRWHDLAAARVQLAELEALAVSSGDRRIRGMAEKGKKLLRDPEVRKIHGVVAPRPVPLRYRAPHDATTELVGYGGETIVDASDCVALRALPHGLSVAYLNLSGCTSLAALPDDLVVRRGRLTLRGCAQLRRLPRGLGPLHELDLSGCLNIVELPDDLVVTGWIDVAGSGLSALPERLADVGIRWNGVPVDARIAFRPDQLDVSEIMAEPNVERRRVMMERFGFERFMAAAGAEVIDADTDRGGPRRLLRVAIPGDEPLVCVSVICPSTQRHFMLRVPPAMTSCRQAVAWTAGFDDTSAYQPLVET